MSEKIKVEDKINVWAENISTSLKDLRLWDEKEVQSILKANLQMAIKDCLEIQLSDIEREFNETKINIESNTGREKEFYKAKIIKLREQRHERIKALNQIKQSIKRVNKTTVFSRLIFERYGAEVLQEIRLIVDKETDHLN